MCQAQERHLDGIQVETLRQRSLGPEVGLGGDRARLLDSALQEEDARLALLLVARVAEIQQRLRIGVMQQRLGHESGVARCGATCAGQGATTCT